MFSFLLAFYPAFGRIPGPPAYCFYATKTVTTGEGGMIVTRDEQVAERCRVMRLHGISRGAFDRYTSTNPSWRYEVVAPGFKYNMTDLAAAIGLQQLKKAWRFQRRRAEMAARYDAELADSGVTLPPHPSGGDTHSWRLYVIRLDQETRVNRDEFIERMSVLGVGCSVHFIPLHLHPYWRDLRNLQPNHFPLSLQAYRGAVSLPLYTKMTEADQTRVIEDAAIVVLSFALAHILRFDGWPPGIDADRMLLALPVMVVARLSANYKSGIYSRVWRYVSIPDAAHLFYSVGMILAILMALRLAFPGVYPMLTVPISIIVCSIRKRVEQPRQRRTDLPRAD